MINLYRKHFTLSLRLPLIAMLLLFPIVLSGCGMPQGDIDENTPGLFNHYVVYPLSLTLQWMASIAHDNYGLAVIALTIVIRLLLSPLMLKQYRSSMDMKAKMAGLQPELQQLNKKYEGKNDSDAAMKRQQETMELYRKHDVNPLRIGCLPMLLQMPVLTGLYYALRMTPELAEHPFLWFQMGQPDSWLPLIVGCLYWFQFKVSSPQQQMPVEGTGGAVKGLAFIGYIFPVMMMVFAWNVPSAIALYWVVSAAFTIGQSLLFRKLYG